MCVDINVYFSMNQIGLGPHLAEGGPGYSIMTYKMYLFVVGNPWCSSCFFALLLKTCGNFKWGDEGVEKEKGWELRGVRVIFDGERTGRNRVYQQGTGNCRLLCQCLVLFDITTSWNIYYAPNAHFRANDKSMLLPPSLFNCHIFIFVD